MRRRSRAGGKPDKARRRKATALTRRNPPRAARRRGSSTSRKKLEADHLVRERDEALEQLAAASEVLEVISSSPGELAPVFHAMLQNAMRICNAKFGILFRFEGGLFHPTALLDVPAAYADFLKQQGAFAGKPGQLFGRLCESKGVIHVID